MYKNANEIVPESEFVKENFLKRRFAFLTKEYGYGIFDEIRDMLADRKSKDIFDNIIECIQTRLFRFFKHLQRRNVF